MPVGLTYSVRETNAGTLITDYTLTTDSTTTGTKTIVKGVTGTIDLSNKYTQDKGALKIKKSVTLNGAATDTTQVDGTYSFSITSAEGVTPATDATLEITITNGVAVSATLDGEEIAIGEDGYVKIADLPVGEYTVEEDTAGLAEKYITLTSTNPQTVTVEKDNEEDIPTAEFVNNKDVGSLKLTKTW